LCGLFQETGVALTNNGTTKRISTAWQVGNPVFGIDKPSVLTVFLLNAEAPTYYTHDPHTAPGLLSNVVQVQFTIAKEETAV
jgi:hypothetical protein